MASIIKSISLDEELHNAVISTTGEIYISPKSGISDPTYQVGPLSQEWKARILNWLLSDTSLDAPILGRDR